MPQNQAYIGGNRIVFGDTWVRGDCETPRDSLLMLERSASTLSLAASQPAYPV
jgi:hypothetical protein